MLGTIKLPFALNRAISREEKRPTKTGVWSFNKQRFFRFKGKPYTVKKGIVRFLGRHYSLVKYDDI